MCSLYKRGKNGGQSVYHSIYIRSIIKVWERGKSCGKVYPSLYIEYIIKSIMVNKERVRK